MAKQPRIIQPTHSGVRSMVEGGRYKAFDCLEDARGQSEAVVIFEGDYGGTIYLTVPVIHVACNENSLQDLLTAVDQMCWHEPAGSGLFFEPRPVGSGVAGGMGGGTVTKGLWLHPSLEDLGIRGEIQDVLAGRTPHLDPKGRSWK